MGWQSRAPLPLANNGFGVGVSGGKIYALGGQANTTGVYEYNPATDSWATKTVSPVLNYYHQAATDSSGNIYIPKFDDSNAIRKYVPGTDTWSSITDSAAAWDGTAGRWAWFVGDGAGNIYQGGGQTRTDVNRWNGSSWSNALTTITPWAGTPYVGSRAVFYPPNGKIYVVGGNNWTTGDPNTTMAEFTPPGTWATKTSPPVNLISDPSLVVAGSFIYIIGGGVLDQAIIRYDPISDTYVDWIDLPYVEAYFRSGAAFIDPYLHIFGGIQFSSVNYHYRTEVPATGLFTGAESDSFLNLEFTGLDSFDSVFPGDDLYPEEDLYPESG